MKITGFDLNVSQDPSGDRNESPEVVHLVTDIRALSLRKFHWKTQQDIDLIKDLFDDALVFVHITGHASSKDKWIDEMRSGRFVYERIQPQQEAMVALSGDMATLQGRAVFAVNMQGYRASYDIGYTEIYQRKHGAWKLVSLMTRAY